MYDPETANLTPKQLKELRSKDYDYLKDYLLDSKVSETNYIVGDDDDDGYIDNEIEDSNNSLSTDDVESFENEAHESDFISTSISNDSSDNESAVDLLSEYFSSKIAVKMDFDSLREEIDSGEIVNEETSLLMRKQQTILNGFNQSQYKKNLYQKIYDNTELLSNYCADDDILVSEKSTSEKTLDSFILPRSGLSNNTSYADYHNIATVSRRTNEDASAILPRIKWGSLKKLYLYQFNNNERYISALGSARVTRHIKGGSDKISIPPVSQYSLDNGYSLDTINPDEKNGNSSLDNTNNLLLDNKKKYNLT